MPHEFGQMGLTWPAAAERQAALEEALQVIGPLLRGETVTYEGQRFRAEA